MARYAEEGILPIPRARLWQILEAHLDEAGIRSIHPDILAQRTVEGSGPVRVLERSIRARGVVRRSTWRVTHDPPDGSRWEIIGGDGPFAVGSWMANRYSDEGAGTRVRSEGELRIVGLPFFQRTVLRRVFNHIEAEDLAAARRS